MQASHVGLQSSFTARRPRNLRLSVILEQAARIACNAHSTTQNAAVTLPRLSIIHVL